MTDLIRIHNLSLSADHKRILDGLDLTIAEQEIHALLGTNGCGKSTLAFAIMGCEGYRPCSGTIMFGRQVINDLTIHERARLGITLAWQEPARFEGISIAKYLSLGSPTDDPARYLQRVGLAPKEYLPRMVDKTLSGGQRKRIELASVLALKPKLAVLDEPDSGIDMLSINEIAGVIGAFKAQGASVLLITHREEMALVSDRASQLCGGKIVFSGTPSDVARRYQARKCIACDGHECGNR